MLVGGVETAAARPTTPAWVALAAGRVGCFGGLSAGCVAGLRRPREGAEGVRHAVDDGRCQQRRMGRRFAAGRADACGHSRERRQRVAVGLDAESPEEGFRYVLPVEKAMHPDTLLAYALNGETLPKDHGFPLRALLCARSCRVGWLAAGSRRIGGYAHGLELTRLCWHPETGRGGVFGGGSRRGLRRGCGRGWRHRRRAFGGVTSGGCASVCRRAAGCCKTRGPPGRRSRCQIGDRSSRIPVEARRRGSVTSITVHIQPTSLLGSTHSTPNQFQRSPRRSAAEE